MCTLTWRHQPHLELFFNRDELKTRGRAHPPTRFRSAHGTQYLAPIDPDAGGTWMLANEHGLVICLLNRWHETAQVTPTKSRGKVVLELCDTTQLTELASQIPYLCHGCRPFDLISFSGEECLGFRWHHDKLEEFTPTPPLTSSSYRFEEVQAARQKAFATAKDLASYQSSSEQESTAYTVRMNRPDAQTWSRSQLTVREDVLHWDYYEESPHLATEPKLHKSQLARAQQHSARILPRTTLSSE